MSQQPVLTSPASLVRQSYCIASHMPYCTRCDRSFSSMRALWQHEADSSNHHICDDCDKDFPTWTGLKDHWVQSPRHSYCQYCDDHFPDSEDLEEHLKDSHHYCSSCRRVFKNDFGLKEHYRLSSAHQYCSPCDRHFQSASNLQTHLNSSIHRPKEVKCPFRCGMAFVSRSALVLHLEAGGCSSGIDRKTVNRYVRQFDKSGVITDPSRLLTSGSEDVTYMATRASWNGRGYECYLCDNEYSTLKGLNQHLTSPRHQEKVYICRGPSCGCRFVALSALVQHIESEKCGVLKYRAVQSTMDSLLGQMGRLTM